jgi:PIN domain nuclease of toxin-antitoxin system
MLISLRRTERQPIAWGVSLVAGHIFSTPSDPFDRLLVSTAIVEALTLVSADETFVDYGLTRLW